MRAIVVDQFGPPEWLRVGEVAKPMPGPDEVMLAVQMLRPSITSTSWSWAALTSFCRRFPFIPGKGPAGIVAALGETVTSLRIGDRVLAMTEQGGYAEAVTVRADHCYRLPPSMSFNEAASLSLVYDTAWFALRERARLETGETVLVLGASGGVGRAAIQLAHAMGARVLAGILRPERAEVGASSGAHAVIEFGGRRPAQQSALSGLCRDRGARRRYHSGSSRRSDIGGGHACARLAWPAGGDRVCFWPDPDPSGRTICC